MLKNICIICADRTYAKEVATVLAERLDMQWFDVLDMVMFDDRPRSLAETLSLQGEASVVKHQLSCLKYACTFSNTIILCEIGICENEEVWKYLHSSSIIIYLHVPAQKALVQRSCQEYASAEERRFFVKDKKLFNLEITLSKQNANIIVNCNQKPPIVTASSIVRKLEEFAQNL